MCILRLSVLFMSDLNALILGEAPGQISALPCPGTLQQRQGVRDPQEAQPGPVMSAALTKLVIGTEHVTL